MDLNGDQNSYAVEVSGWDMSQSFFVEITDLAWTADGIKQVRLRRPVREGSMLFVRLMQPPVQNDNYPIACEATKVLKNGASGSSVVQLVQLRPRALIRDALRELKMTSLQLT